LDFQKRSITGSVTIFIRRIIIRLGGSLAREVAEFPKVISSIDSWSFASCATSSVIVKDRVVFIVARELAVLFAVDGGVCERINALISAATVVE